MDSDGGLGLRNLGYYKQTLKGNQGLQLMPPNLMEQRDTKNMLFNGAYFYRSCGIMEPMPPNLDFMRDGWVHNTRDKIHHAMPENAPGFGILSSVPIQHSSRMSQLSEPPVKEENPLQTDEIGKKGKKGRKRLQGTLPKVPKPKKQKKAPAPREEAGNGPRPRGRSVPKNTEVVINGISLDISVIPTPVCSCTGAPQQCYRWGVGGWQSACCTTSISEYPLPMSPKRHGSRIAGRKMSQGAFKKVLEKLAGEGYNLSNSIDLRPFWAKHGTNKFVTIR